MKFLLIVLVGLLSWRKSFAYIDPGTTGSIVGGISAGVGVVLTFMGSVALAVILKIKKIWYRSLLWKGLLLLAVGVVIFIGWFIFVFII